MKISDSIRKWCDLAEADSIPCDELRYLADRIDAEMVELPKDADGVPIHVGDTVYTTFMEKVNVVRICIMPTRWLIKCEYPNDRTAFLNPRALTHTSPDSLERIADELEAWCDDADVDEDGILAEYAAKLRLAGGE